MSDDARAKLFLGVMARVELDGGPCPRCGTKALIVTGENVRPSADDRAYEADAVTACCAQQIGTLRREANTIFGVREDMAVLGGRCRVY